MSGLLLRGGMLIPMTSREAIGLGDILIQDGRIAAIYPGGAPEEVRSSVSEIRNVAGQLVLPGLVNAHTHAAMTLFRSFADDLPLMRWLKEAIWPAEEKLTGDDVYWGTKLAIAEMLKSGITTFADMYFFMDQVAQASLDTGIRAHLSRGMVGFGPSAEKALTESAAFFRQYNGAGDGLTRVWLGPHAPYTCSPDYLKRVMALADELGTGLHIHLSETATEVDDMTKQYGLPPVELMDSIGLFERPVLAAHCVHLNEKERAILVEKGVGIAHNPVSNMKLASGVAPVEALRQAQAILALGTDGAASNNNLDLIEEMRQAALLQKVHLLDPLALPAYEALEMATIGGARALRWDDEIGTLEVGKRADLITINLQQPHLCPDHDPVSRLVYAAKGADVATVLVNGRILVDQGRLTCMDEEEVMAKATAAAYRLTRQ
ncbi:amidohydrolase [Heliophilum fasciatum]|uniref:5-methylthioadenosine/S-adenosylhomocysteine deaminase n=1 Tax=Heliophilum fasciatum TaxID=35700 RepID=A0A4R2RUR0_9FIRM|nr:amidohydrolase [Heliophilum fasciatum]MCW2278430.1 5-methylthioadenosine/S-adenosylhomocysteine deaminase [Heliophilum fasciatum]TCP63671.1 5-methylthioadenosine/S-adenosylhomocysteine deaminase [Heliophilum fasciatum]